MVARQSPRLAWRAFHSGWEVNRTARRQHPCARLALVHGVDTKSLQRALISFLIREWNDMTMKFTIGHDGKGCRMRGGEVMGSQGLPHDHGAFLSGVKSCLDHEVRRLGSLPEGHRADELSVVLLQL